MSTLKNEAWDENPHGLFKIFDLVDGTFLPEVAVEIGFSEHLDELCFDMEQWLQKCLSMRTEDARPCIKTLN